MIFRDILNYNFILFYLLIAKKPKNSQKLKKIEI